VLKNKKLLLACITTLSFVPILQASYWEPKKAPACHKKKKKHTKPRPTITAIVNKDLQLTTLAKLLDAAHMTDLLSSDVNFTLFAPNDEAFQALPYGKLKRLSAPENRHQLTELINYHLVGKKYSTTKLAQIPENKKFIDGIQTISGNTMSITKRNDIIYINDARIIKTVHARNGVIHIINRVLEMPDRK
jgi:uncharacterized surface protein with fasciclin (FAS1) repeats